MSIQPDNERVKELFQAYALRCEQFSKEEMHESKTPDFRVYQGSEMAFFCEVKSAAEDEWLNRQLDSAPAGMLVGGARHDPIYNRIENKIHEAIKQFDAVNPIQAHPNVLVLVNHDRHADKSDLEAVLTGSIPLQGGGRLHGFTNYSHGRIRDDKFRIHLYLWLDEALNGKFFLFSERIPTHYAKLKDLFSAKDEYIRPID
jgi:hypothetical protein